MHSLHGTRLGHLSFCYDRYGLTLQYDYWVPCNCTQTVTTTTTCATTTCTTTCTTALLLLQQQQQQQQHSITNACATLNKIKKK